MVSRQGWDQLYNDNVDDVLLACHYAHLKSKWINDKFSLYNSLLEAIPASGVDTLLPLFISFITSIVGELSSALQEVLSSKPSKMIFQFVQDSVKKISPLLKTLSRPQ